MPYLAAGGGIDIKHRALTFFDELVNGNFGRFITNAYFIAFLITVVVFLLAKVIDPSSFKFVLITLISVGIIMVLHDNALLRLDSDDDDFPQEIKMTVMPRVGANSADGGMPEMSSYTGGTSSGLAPVLGSVNTAQRMPQTTDELLDVIQF